MVNINDSKVAIKWLIEKRKERNRIESELSIIYASICYDIQRSIDLHTGKRIYDDYGIQCFYDHIDIYSYDEEIHVKIVCLSMINGGKKGKKVLSRRFLFSLDYYMENIRNVLSDIRNMVTMKPNKQDKYSLEWFRRTFLR